MPNDASPRPLVVALIGNPNTGKSTLFTALAGVRQRVGNYPGVTVEKKIGSMSHAGRAFSIVDLPGTYSLAPRSPDEMVAVDVLFGRDGEATAHAEHARPDAVLCIVDASNLERNLYLVSQVLELGLPTVLALNMIDAAAERGIAIDSAKLGERLGVPVVELQAHRGIGIAELKDKLHLACGATPPAKPHPFPQAFQDEVERLEELTDGRTSIGRLPRYLAERLLLDSSGYLQQRLLPTGDAAIAAHLTAARERLKQAGLPIPAVEAMARYGWVGKQLEGLVRRQEQNTISLTDRIDRVLTHRVWGSLLFTLMMVVLFQAIFSWAEPIMGLIETEVGAVGEWIEDRLDEGPLRSLLVDGVVSGVGGVVVFLPQILILFLFIGVLEDCGYMARAAYLMDRLMAPIGLSGKSFIPLLSSFACAIPGVMATRVIENRRDRLTTMLIAPLMSCSARLPVYILMIAAFVPSTSLAGGYVGLQGLVMFSMYLVGILTAAGVAFVLKRTLLRGPTPPFVLELPTYKMPSPRTVLYRVVDRGWAFLKNAGTLILAVSIVVWAALYYPHDSEQVEAPFAERKAAAEAKVAAAGEGTLELAFAKVDLDIVEKHIAGEYQRQSYLGRAGHVIEPLVRPLGWDWRIGSAAIASFPAREVVVATLGILFDVGGDLDVEVEEDRGRMATVLQNATWDGTDRKLFTLASALSLMVFFALCAQCAATLAVIRRETNGWRWPIFTFCYMTTLAYLAALLTFQVFRAFGY